MALEHWQRHRTFYKSAIWVFFFGLALAYWEAAVVVYLRQLYYPAGFTFPLVRIDDTILLIELGRELSTMVVLLGFAWLAGKSFYERFGYFITAFGIWDIFYYVFLKVLLDWPQSIFDWDVLYLIPLPWLGPVIAPVSIALLMIAAGLMILYRFSLSRRFSAAPLSWLIVCAASALILFSFVNDFGAAFEQRMPRPYAYWQLVAGDALFIFAFVLAWRRQEALS